jgi:hypothetical protein
MDGISTAVFLGPVSSELSEGKTSEGTLFGPTSTTLTSHKFDVFDVPMVLKAYGLSGSETVTLQQQVQIGSNSSPVVFVQNVILNGHEVQLSVTNSMLIIDVPGSYNCILNSGLGTVAVTVQKTAMSYHSYGLRAFSQAP